VKVLPIIFSGVTDEGKGVKIECSAVVENSPVTPPVTEAKVFFFRDSYFVLFTFQTCCKLYLIHHTVFRHRQMMMMTTTLICLVRRQRRRRRQLRSVPQL
jgi:hypothetical protein